MADLVAFILCDDLQIVAHAAIAHAQFETIHPFADGNGRTGRAIVHAMVRAKGLVRSTTAPISAGLLINTTGYTDALMEPVRLGIISFGVQGATYAELIERGQVPNLVIGAFADIAGTARGAAAAAYPGVPVFDDHKAMLTSGQIDAVVVTAPHYLHPQLGIDALQAGIHTLVEKPAGVYTQQVNRLNAVAASRPELTFGMVFNQRNNPLYRRIKQIVDAGEIGTIRRSNWIITTWWRPQG